MSTLTAEQVEQLRGIMAPKPVFSMSDLLDQTPRTLLYGYTCDRHTFHVYWTGEHIVRFIYDFRTTPLATVRSSTHLDPSDLRPDKRAYPEYTDAQFAFWMARNGYPIPFTTWEEPKKPGPFFGLVHTQDLATCMATLPTEVCGSRGPRIGESGVPVCKLAPGHEGMHHPGPFDGWTGVNW